MKLSVDGAGIEDFTAIVDDTDFFATARSRSATRCRSHWDAEDAIVLGTPQFLN